MATDIIPTPEIQPTGPDEPFPPQVPDGPAFADPSPMSDSHNNGGPYKDFTFDIEYVEETGRDVAPVAGDGTQPGVAYRYHNGAMLMRVKWSTERDNAKPVVPHYDTGDPNNIRVESIIYPAMPLQGIGRVTYRISGMFVYKLIIPKTLERGSIYPCGSSPAENRPSSANFYGPLDFSKALFDASFALEANATVTPFATVIREPFVPPLNDGGGDPGGQDAGFANVY